MPTSDRKTRYVRRAATALGIRRAMRETMGFST
jgi:hypothetical protein